MGGRLHRNGRPISPESALSRPEPDYRYAAVYVYGPSIRIQNVEVDGFNYEFRRFDPNRILIYGGAEVGSCPYVYVYSKETNSWEDDGVILKGKDSKNKKSLEERSLTSFTGRVLIKEQDPEVSFIDSIYIKARRADGSDAIFYAKDKRLRSTDNRYLVLKEGDSFFVDFEVRAEELRAESYVIGSTGYYVPKRQREFWISDSGCR